MPRTARSRGRAEPDRLRVLVRRTAGYAVLTPLGDLYVDTSGPLQEALAAQMSGPRPRIVLDLAAVAVCDAHWLGVMDRARRLVTERGGWLRLTGVRPLVRQALQATRLASALPGYPTLATAVAGLPPHPADHGQPAPERAGDTRKPPARPRAPQRSAGAPGHRSDRKQR